MRSNPLRYETFQSLENRMGKLYLPTLTVTILLTSFTMISYGTIVSVAVPSVMGEFGVGQDKAQLLATGFYVAMTLSQLVSSWLISKISHYYTYLLSVILFSFASILGAISEDYYLIVISRITQGISAGILLNQTYLSIVQAFPAERRATALILFTCSTISAMGAGPLIGGIAIEYVNWRYIFVAPLPLLLITMILGNIVMPKSETSKKLSFDWLGMFLITLSLSSFLAVISDGQRQGWTSNYILILFIVSLLTAASFLYTQLNRQNRLLDFRLFKNKVYFCGIIVTFCTSMGNFGAIYAVPIFAQIIQKLSPIDAGFLMFPASVFTLLCLPIISFYSNRIISRNACIFGLFLFSLGLYPLVSADINTPYIYMICFAAISRIGIGINNPFLGKVTISEIPPEQLQSAISVMNFFRILGTAIGTSIWVVFLEMRASRHSTNLINTQTADNSTSTDTLEKLQFLLGVEGIRELQSLQLSLYMIGELIYKEALTLAYQDGFILLLGVFIFAIIVSLSFGRR